MTQAQIPPRMSARGPMPDGHWIVAEPSPRWVRNFFGGETIADSRRVLLVRESRRLPAYYFPRADVRMDLLRPSDSETHCPYKGTASYWSVDTGRAEHRDIVWTYRFPLPESQKIAGLACFYTEKVDLFVDGELQ